MIELHGWIKICAAYEDEDRHSETQEDKVICEVENYIQNLQYKTIKKIDAKNGNYFINYSSASILDLHFKISTLKTV